MYMCARNGEVTGRERDVRVYKAREEEQERVREVLIVIWEVSTASRPYARMEWGDDDGDDDASSVTTSSK